MVVVVGGVVVVVVDGAVVVVVLSPGSRSMRGRTMPGSRRDESISTSMAKYELLRWPPSAMVTRAAPSRTRSVDRRVTRRMGRAP